MRTTLLSLAIGTSLLGCRAGDSAAPQLLRATDPAATAAGVSHDTVVATAPRPSEMPPSPTRIAPAQPVAPSPPAIAGKAATGDAMPPVPPASYRAVASAARVAAGEWDDNANYRDYLSWISGHHDAELDTQHREFVVVTDAHGRPVPNCEVRVSAGRASATLTTTASGRALLFPVALGLGAHRSYEATVSCGNQQAAATLDTAAVDTINRIELGGDRALPARRTVDLAFVLDTTGSMAEEIEAVRSTIGTVAARLQNDQVDVRIGLVEYRDRVDPEITHTYPFSDDAAAFAASVQHLRATGGGDYPEDMQMGLQTALDGLTWSSTSIARLAVVIADAPPHLDYQDERSYADTAKRAAARGIKIYTVAASGMDDQGQLVMRELSQFTGATNMFVLRGGAGPQSTGGGDPKSSCGGTHTNYSSGNLDTLILDKVRNELAAVDADPLIIAGVGQDENAKPCEQRVQIARSR